MYHLTLDGGIDVDLRGLLREFEQGRVSCARAKQLIEEAAAAREAEWRELGAELAENRNWGYFDDSGCTKGGDGVYRESWIGEGHPQDRARDLLKAGPSEPSTKEKP